MNRIVAQILLAVATICGSGCQTYPILPDLKGNAAIVLGFTTDSAQPYEGGTLQSDIDEYKSQCILRFIEKPQQVSGGHHVLVGRQ